MPKTSIDGLVVTHPTSIAPVEDHRIRVARERRERTRKRLVDTILATYRGDQNRGPAVLEQILECAKVSKSNFYKYFSSLDAAVSDLGEILADEMTIAIISNLQHVKGPSARSAMSFQLFLMRAAVDPRWGSFVTHGTYLNPQHKMLLRIRKDFELGISSGEFDIKIVDAAVHFTIGAMVEGMRHILEASPSHDYIQEATVMMLRGIGVSNKKAHAVMLSAFDQLHTSIGARFSWWRPLQ